MQTANLHARVRHLDSAAAVSLFGNGKLDTLALGQADPWLLLANDEDVALPGSEGVVNGILDVDNVETTVVSLTVSDDTNTTHVATTSDHGDHTGVEPDKVGNLASREVNLDGVVDLDGRVGVSDRASIMRNQVWDSSFAQLHSLDLAEFVLCLGGFNTVDGETALGVVDQTEVLASLLDRNDVHETRRVGDIGSHFAINLDETLHQDSIGLSVVQGVLEAVSQEDDQGKAVALFMRPRRRLRGIGARELVQQPVRRRTEAFLMLLRTTTHLDLKL